MNQKSPANEDASDVTVISTWDARLTYLQCWFELLHKLFYYLVFESFGKNRLTEFHRLQPCPIEGDLGNQATASSTLIIIKST